MLTLHRSPDLIVEVAHPSITVDYGEVFLDVADYMVCCRKVKSDRKVSVFSGQKLLTRIIYSLESCMKYPGKEVPMGNSAKLGKISL